MTAPLAMTFGPEVCGSPEGAAREWLVADGLGGYATGTASGLRTRRYHGLLIVADGTGRRLALASLDPVLLLPSGARVRLGVHAWSSGATDPRGDLLLESFTISDGLPTWRWRVGGAVLERTVAMEHGRASVAIEHRLLAGGPVILELDALGTWRDANGERFASGGDPAMDTVAAGAVVEQSWRIAGPGFTPGGEWYRGVHMQIEADRGLPADEDLWYLGRFSAALIVDQSVGVSAWAGDLSTRPPEPSAVIAASRARAQAVLAHAKPNDAVDATLALASDAFIIQGPDVVAGYPWFGTWSRDTMTSYEGLFLETGRADEGAALLRRYAATLSEGMLANNSDTGEFNTVDATFWFLHAVGRHVARTGDHDLAAELLPALDGVVTAHIAGTRYGIRVDDDGLITEGADGLALTWMDARINGVPVTRRAGKPVEVNALWIDGLASLSDLRRRVGKAADDLAALESRARASFAARFPTTAGLYDVVDGPGGDDASVRPNQLLAAFLPHGPLADGAGSSRVLGAIADLLTPLGPRSLLPGSPGYLGQHRGGPSQRDAAYHQGTVWPWLAGPWVEVALRAGRGEDAAHALAGLEAHLLEWGLGSVSETADGDAPHGATGCPFQAWSVAELLRARRLLHVDSEGRRSSS